MKKIMPLFLLMVHPAIAAEFWTPREKTLEGVYLTLAVADWAQTRYIAKHPDQHFEKNSLIGRHPSTGRVNTYFTLLIGTHLAVINLLDHNWREPVQWLSIAYAAHTVSRNHAIGIGMEF